MPNHNPMVLHNQYVSPHQPTTRAFVYQTAIAKPFPNHQPFPVTFSYFWGVARCSATCETGNEPRLWPSTSGASGPLTTNAYDLDHISKRVTQLPCPTNCCCSQIPPGETLTLQACSTGKGQAAPLLSSPTSQQKRTTAIQAHSRRGGDHLHRLRSTLEGNWR